MRLSSTGCCLAESEVQTTGDVVVLAPTFEMSWSLHLATGFKNQSIQFSSLGETASM